MSDLIERLLDRYDSGRLSRRRLIEGLALVGVAGSASRAQPASSTFRTVGLNHIALSVVDVPRARDFYVRHLGLEVSRESAGSCFLRCGEEHFVALFRSDRAAMNHYCYSVEDYSVEQAAAKLREAGIEPRVQGGRIYFDDADGLEVQLAAPELGTL